MWGSGKWTLDSTWRVCSTPATAALSSQLRAASLTASSGTYAALDAFPAGLAAYDWSVQPGMCSLALGQTGAKKVLYLLDWQDLTETQRNNLELYFPEIQPWIGRLEVDPQSYALSYDSAKNRILVLGGSAQGAQFGAIGLLRDASNTSSALVWEPKHVLDYGELQMRLSSFKGTNFSDNSDGLSWRNAVIWNRLTHVNNDGQMFTNAVRDTSSKATLDHMANTFTERQVKLIPRLYSVQASFTDFGPDITGLLASPEYPVGGIHLTEGMRVPFPDDSQTLVPPDALEPITAQQLMMARGMACGYLLPQTDATPEINRNEQILLSNTNFFLDCRTDNDDYISLCVKGDDCPTLNGAPMSGLAIYLTSDGSFSEVGAEGADGGPGYSSPVAVPSGYELPHTEPHRFVPGHVYLLALRYRLDGPSTAHIYYMAGQTPHGVNRTSDAQYLLPTGQDFALASYIFRVPEADVVTLNSTANAIHDTHARVSIQSTGALGTYQATDEDGDPIFDANGNPVYITGADTALHIDTLQLYDLGDTLAYPVVTGNGQASCSGFPGQNSNCTMNMVGWNSGNMDDRRYPDALLDEVFYDEPCEEDEPRCVWDGTTGVRTRAEVFLSMPSANRNTEFVSGGHYRTVLVPGLWPRATKKASLLPAEYPPELLRAQSFERSTYWQTFPFVGPGRLLLDGFLGRQLQGLHQTLAQHPNFLETRLVDLSNSYTEAEGFNRSQGFGDDGTSSLSRLADFHCRMQHVLLDMGYDTGIANPSYTPNRPGGLQNGACSADLKHTSLLYYGDMFTPVHNGYFTYHAAFSGARPWFSYLDTHPLDTGEFPPPGLGADPTFIPWWYTDDPELLLEYYRSLVDHGPMLFWMGADAKTENYHHARGSHREFARLAAAHPAHVYGAGIYYHGSFTTHPETKMTPAEERAWEQVASDCMWNPRWSLLRLWEMKPQELDNRAFRLFNPNPNFEFIDAYTYSADTAGLFYGYPWHRGTPESLRLNAYSDVVFPFSIPALSQPAQYLVRFFAKGYRDNSVLGFQGGDVSFSEKVFANDFTVYEFSVTAQAQQDTLPLRIQNLDNTPLLLDGLALYQQLPNFGYDTSGKPAFPSDIDERKSNPGWQYCDSVHYLQELQ